MEAVSTTKTPQPPSRIEDISDRVVADIRHRGLVQGDRYLTAEEARDCFGVGKNVINDALKRLAEQGVLVRKQRSGTFVGPNFQVKTNGNPSVPAISVVHIFMPMGYYRSNVIPGSVFVDELTNVIPGTSVQVHHVEDKELTGYTLNYIDRLVNAGSNKEALILLRSSRQVQLAAQASGLPTVVFGSTYPDVNDVSSIDPDQSEAGRLAVEAALAQGHQRFALIMRNTWHRGDNLLMEGMSQALAEAGIGIDRVRVLSTAEDAAVIEHDVAELLASDPIPTALICRSRLHATAAARGVIDRGLKPMEDVLVVSVEASASGEDHADLAVVPTHGSTKQVQQIGELLLKQAKTPGSEPVSIRIPVHVEDPRGRNQFESTSSPRKSDS